MSIQSERIFAIQELFVGHHNKSAHIGIKLMLLFRPYIPVLMPIVVDSILVPVLNTILEYHNARSVRGNGIPLAGNNLNLLLSSPTANLVLGAVSSLAIF